MEIMRCTCKSLLATGNDDRADILVIVVLAQCVVQLSKERAAEGVEGLGAVQSNYHSSIAHFSQLFVVLAPTQTNARLGSLSEDVLIARTGGIRPNTS